MLAAGDRWAVVESTSHGLAQQRVRGTAYDVAVLTNVTSEHLEFHGTLDAYRAAKRSLFGRLAVGRGEPREGLGQARGRQRRRTPGGAVGGGGSSTPAPRSCATDSPASWARATPTGSTSPPPGSRSHHRACASAMQAGGWRGEVPLQLAGRFNVANALAAMGVAVALGLDLDAAAVALGALPAVPGRMQRVDEGQPFSVIIDYAHTAESLAKVLDELAPTDPAAGRIAVFGSAGDRDPSKREPMGYAAGQRCRAGHRDRRGPAGRGPRGHPREHRAWCRGGRQATRPGPPAHPRPGRGHRRGHATGPPRAMRCCSPARATRRPSRRAAGELPWDEAAAPARRCARSAPKPGRGRP